MTSFNVNLDTKCQTPLLFCPVFDSVSLLSKPSVSEPKHVPCRVLQVWQWKLDSSLPGRLGQIGDWLHRAEQLLDQPLTYTDLHQENADMLHKRLEHHKVHAG